MIKAIVIFINLILFRTAVLRLNKNVKLICMSGSPRSGTTFIAEVLSEALNNCTIIWEPLQDDIILNMNNKMKNIVLRPTMEEFKMNKDLQSYLFEVINVNKLNYYNTWFRNSKFREKLFFGNKKYAIVKFVRGNGLLDSFSTISPKVKIVFGIVRNPYSVISSQIKHHEFKGHPAYSTKSKYINNINFCIESIEQSLVRDLAITWAVDFLNAISSKEKVFFYEEILTNPGILVDFFNNANIVFYKEPVFHKISSTYVGEKININFQQKYKDHLKEAELLTIDEVLKIFKIQYPTFN